MIGFYMPDSDDMRIIYAAKYLVDHGFELRKDKKFADFGFNVININGHCIKEIIESFEQARNTKNMPTCIIAKTVKGKGVDFMENKAEWHGKAPSEEQYKLAMECL